MAKIDLEGKPICISGASSGIGWATALACARAGMPVCVMARREGKLGELVAQIEQGGGKAIAVVGDVIRQDDCDRAIQATVEAFGSIYSVYANAGVGLEEMSYSTTDEQLRWIFEVNFFGTMNLVRPAVEWMLRAHQGHVLICSSCIGKMAMPYCGAYCATKAAQSMMGRSMAVELKPHGIHVSTVHPVGTRTEFFDTAKAASESDGASFDDHAPKWAMQDAETVARATVRALRRPKPEVWPSWARLVRLGMAGGMAFPRAADWGLAGMAKKHEARTSDRTG